MSCPRSAVRTPKPVNTFSRTSATPVPVVSWKRHRFGMHVYQTEPSRYITPAPVPSSGSLMGPLKELILSGTPSPFVSTRCVTRSSSFR